MKRYSTCREQSSRLSSRAQTFGYVPHSGAEQLWADAKAHEIEGETILEVPLASDEVLSQANKVLYSFGESGAVIQEIYGQLVSDDTVNVRVWNDGDLKANTNKDQLWLARLSGTLQVCDDDVQPGVSSVQGSEAGGRCGPASGSSPARWG